VKNPDYRDTMYVVDLVVPNTVNTMPEPTLEAVADHGEIMGDQVHPNFDDAAAVFADLKEAGIDYDDVIEVLIKEGVEKFVSAFDDLTATVEKAMRQAGSDR
jgi:transaldolase